MIPLRRDGVSDLPEALSLDQLVQPRFLHPWFKHKHLLQSQKEVESIQHRPRSRIQSLATFARPDLRPLSDHVDGRSLPEALRLAIVVGVNVVQRFFARAM